MDFIYSVWLYLAFALLGAVGFFVYEHTAEIPRRKLIMGLLLMSFPCHMFEERIFPGGFAYIYGQMTGMDQTKVVALVVNVLVLAILTALFLKKSDKAWSAMLFGLMGFAEFVLHLFLGIKSYGMFAAAGQALPYSPGLATALFLMVPLGIMAFADVVKSGELTPKNLGKMLLAMVLVAGFTIALPNKMLSGVGPNYDLGFYSALI